MTSSGGEAPLLPAKPQMLPPQPQLYRYTSFTSAPLPPPPLRPTTSTMISRCIDDELRIFRSFLRWMCLDQSGACRAVVSWSVFFFLAVAVPATSHYALSFRPERRPYDLVAQVSLTAISLLSFLTLSDNLRRHGLRRFLFLHKLPSESERVRESYTARLHGSFRLLSCFVVPCSAAELAYKVWWYSARDGRIPFLGDTPVVSYCVACALELASWTYRTANFLLACVLFRLICHLHILRLQDFVGVFEHETDVTVVLREHLRVRRQLKVISHRFRVFILLGIVVVTASQLAATLVTLEPRSDDNLFNTGELALCSIVLVTGLLICLRSAAKITHKAQALTSHAAKWHVCATVDSFTVDPEASFDASTGANGALAATDSDEDDEEEESSDDDGLGGTDILHPHVHTISFQKRQALVTYLENNRSGITIFGFTLDRAWLQTIFTLEMMMFLWLLGKTIGIS